MTAPNILQGRKILITGPAGQIAFPMARALARDNEVWGIARFTDAEQRREVEEAGVRTLAIDLAKPDFSSLPRDFTHLLHLAATVQGDDYDGAISINAEGTGLLLSHCRTVEAALIMSTVAVYKPHPDPSHAYCEDDPLGDAMLPGMAAYSVAKIAQEAVARYCAREFGIPITVARMGASYGPRGGLPTLIAQAVAQGRPWITRSDPCPYNPIHDDDMFDQVAPLLDAASVPATIVNWAGDDMVSVQEMAACAGELLDAPARIEIAPAPGAQPGSGVDNRRRLAITGPCRVHWREGLRRVLAQLYPDRVRPENAPLSPDT
ncbi:NAD-dependent epimerase/dehydratase family protein [Sphingobium herbicidovorans NBRC 16415]|uniref:NAD-dependent epimerase/dehydratase family protein n=1 Tax=Sphingobium herbicidovorans (strain ATCC 700291 / DSM 11019 / CCUG 56400 / KCTC 2939 / LMG 18315 / NBRC 16415 / MH) TaxID=1219045 RepID=A0A086P636_SPHHM|nr:NAD(P)-dependent oxidoreductase [Sphingobium herbicidovorans]KFG88854.1 NAD-dependent epimerase/dehydratase family protein [Sphingobium herbicidovorans NBRC 16415]